MFGCVATVLLALAGAEPPIQLDLVIARMRPGTGEDFKGPLLRRSNVPVEFKEGKKGAFAGVVPPDGGKLMTLLQKFESRGHCKLLAQPRLVTKSGQPASFLDGGEAAIPVPVGLGKVGVQFEEFGLRVNTLPVVLADGSVSLEFDCETSEPTRWVEELGCNVMKRETHRYGCTVATMKAGHTLVLGGIRMRETVTEKRAVPGLCGLPLVGELFRWKTMRHKDHEVMVLVTPHVIAETRGAAGR